MTLGIALDDISLILLLLDHFGRMGRKCEIDILWICAAFLSVGSLHLQQLPDLWHWLHMGLCLSHFFFVLRHCEQAFDLFEIRGFSTAVAFSISVWRGSRWASIYIVRNHPSLYTLMHNKCKRKQNLWLSQIPPIKILSFEDLGWLRWKSHSWKSHDFDKIRHFLTKPDKAISLMRLNNLAHHTWRIRRERVKKLLRVAFSTTTKFVYVRIKQNSRPNAFSTTSSRFLLAFTSDCCRHLRQACPVLSNSFFD